VIVFFCATALACIVLEEDDVDWDAAEIPAVGTILVEGSRCSASSVPWYGGTCFCCTTAASSGRFGIIGRPFTSLPHDEAALLVSVVDDGEVAAVAGLTEVAEAETEATACGTAAVMAMGGRSVGVSSTELVGDTLGLEDIVMVVPFKYINYVLGDVNL